MELTENRDDFHLGPRTQSFMAQDIVNYLLQP